MPSLPGEQLAEAALEALATLARLARLFVEGAEEARGLLRCDLSALARCLPTALAAGRRLYRPDNGAFQASLRVLHHLSALQAVRTRECPPQMRLAAIAV